MPTTHPPATTTADTLQFSRYADVVQALRHPQLVPLGSVDLAAAPPSVSPRSPSVSPHSAMRAAVQQALTPKQLLPWREAFSAHMHALVDALPNGTPVDLVTALAEPGSLELARIVTGAPSARAEECATQARTIYLAAAAARDGRPSAGASAATAAMAKALAGAASPATAFADVQTFVALSQTIPALLAGAWRVLIADAEALNRLLSAPQRVAGCVGELLRLGSPAQAVFRQAAADLDIGPQQLRRGDTVALLLGAANRDPARFVDPERLDLARDSSGQLGLGLGLHHCAGMPLVHMALTVATQALLEGCTSLALADPGGTDIAWRGGFAMRAPASLFVVRQPWPER